MSRTWLLSIFVVAACPRGPTPVTTIPDAAVSTAEASPKASFEPLTPGWQAAADPRLTLVVENRASKPLRVNVFVATSPPLAIEGKDDRGAPIPLGPPPTPREFTDADFVTIAPGDTERFPMSAQDLARLPAGRYHITSRVFPSASLDFDVR
jgi:hypothetical protein